jgi:hypothetical protein
MMQRCGWMLELMGGRLVEVRCEVLLVRALGLDFLAGQIDGAAPLFSKRRAKTY